MVSSAPTGLEIFWGRFPRTALRLSWANIQRPYGAGELFGALSQDCAALVLGYYPSAPTGRFFTVRNVHFRRNPPTRVKLLLMNGL